MTSRGTDRVTWVWLGVHVDWAAAAAEAGDCAGRAAVTVVDAEAAVAGLAATGLGVRAAAVTQADAAVAAGATLHTALPSARGTAKLTADSPTTAPLPIVVTRDSK
jgi:hypothetical protein